MDSLDLLIGAFMRGNKPLVLPGVKEGYSAQAGGSVSVGVEPTIFSDSESNDLYSGISLSISGGPPIPAELHGDITNTKIISVNIFELYDNIYNTIMEW